MPLLASKDRCSVQSSAYLKQCLCLLFLALFVTSFGSSFGRQRTTDEIQPVSAFQAWFFIQNGIVGTIVFICLGFRIWISFVASIIVFVTALSTVCLVKPCNAGDIKRSPPPKTLVLPNIPFYSLSRHADRQRRSQLGLKAACPIKKRMHQALEQR